MLRPQKHCPPGTRPAPALNPIHCVPCAPNRGPGFLGTPSGGLFPFSNSSGAGVIPTPSGIPPGPVPPGCMAASIFADCFKDCSGLISSASAGPVCGWSFIIPFGDRGGTVAFSPGVMTFQGSSTNAPMDSKPIPMALPTIFGISGQYFFTEYQSPLGTGQLYYFFLSNFDGSEGLIVYLDDSGKVIFQVGPTPAAPSYIGTWTPNNGSHQVSFTVDALGVPTLAIDGVSIPLAFDVIAPSIVSVVPINSVSILAFIGNGANVSAPYTRIFVTSGIAGADTVFCCP